MKNRKPRPDSKPRTDEHTTVQERDEVTAKLIIERLKRGTFKFTSQWLAEANRLVECTQDGALLAELVAIGHMEYLNKRHPNVYTHSTIASVNRFMQYGVRPAIKPAPAEIKHEEHYAPPLEGAARVDAQDKLLGVPILIDDTTVTIEDAAFAAQPGDETEIERHLREN